VRRVTILGSTGSVGVSTLDVISRQSDQFEVVSLTAHKNDALMAEQCRQWRPQFAVMADDDAAERLHQALHDCSIEVLSGPEAVAKVAAHDDVDVVMAAIVGAAGLLPTLAAANAGKRVLLANKEALVMSGQILIDAARTNGAELLPIDSEHNAIFQCMPRGGSTARLERDGVKRILLTGSGGPFLTRRGEDLSEVTPDQALAHPNWVMGRKISIDSATMMNKGLEVIEACWLFDTGPDQVQVVIHPQSVIHSMVEYIDGSVLAQMGNPDMRTPIAHGLGWPHRMASGVEALDFFSIAELRFERPDFEQFPCLRLGYDAIRHGGTATAVLNAANEIAVQAFLDEKMKFSDIAPLLEEVLAKATIQVADTLEAVLAADLEARELARSMLFESTHPRI
jgi:1-deoxy-D-xylulose-5-phosphate reductoisomerase